MNKKFAFILEIVWLICAVASAIMAIHKTINTSFKESYLMFIVTFICVIMFALRRGIRKYNEKNT